MADLGTEDMNDLIGYAIPGYALVILILVLFRHYSIVSNLIESVGSLTIAGVVAIIGLPIGFVWVTLVYHPVFWKKAHNVSIIAWNDTHIVWNDNKDWNDFCIHIMKGLGKSTISNLPDETKIALIERFFANLREQYGLVTFYHFRHHTVRDFGWVVAIVAALRLVIDMATRSPTGSVILWFALGALGVWYLCLDSAHRLFQTTKQHLAFLTAQIKPQLIKSVQKAMTEPFGANFRIKKPK